MVGGFRQLVINGAGEIALVADWGPHAHQSAIF